MNAFAQFLAYCVVPAILSQAVFQVLRWLDVKPLPVRQAKPRKRGAA